MSEFVAGKCGRIFYEAKVNRWCNETIPCPHCKRILELEHKVEVLRDGVMFETVKKLEVDLAALRHRDPGRDWVELDCGNPEHPDWICYEDNITGCEKCLVADLAAARERVLELEKEVAQRSEEGIALTEGIMDFDDRVDQLEAELAALRGEHLILSTSCDRWETVYEDGSTEWTVVRLREELAALREKVLQVRKTLRYGADEGPVYCSKPECVIGALCKLLGEPLPEGPEGE